MNIYLTFSSRNFIIAKILRFRYSDMERVTNCNCMRAWVMNY